MSAAMKVFVPLDASALSVGADAVAATLASALSRQGTDAEIVRNGSRGLFWLEPLVEVTTPAGRVGFGPVAVADVEGLLAAGMLDPARDFAAGHPLALGLIERHPYLAGQQRLTFARCGIVDPFSLDEYEALGGLKGLRKALAMEPAAVVEEVVLSGLRGRGGAGFPTGIKWRTVAAAEAPRKYVVCNADEGDSGTFADRMLMEGDPFVVIEGMAIAGIATGAEKGFIYIRSEYPHSFRAMRKAIRIAYDNELLGRDVLGSGKVFDLEARLGGGAYICGEETSLLESLEGRRGQVRFKPPLPAISGLFGKPTVINNLISLASVPIILAEGGAFYRDFGMGRSHGTLPFQLAGNIKHGGLVESAFGLTLRDLVEGFGGGTASGRPIRAIQVGGPLGAYWPASLLDVPMDYESFVQHGGMVGHGGIVVFDDTVDLAAQAEFAFQFCAIESCGKCTPCRLGSTRGAETIGKIRRGEDIEANLDLVRDLAEVMRDGSLCALGGLTPMPVLSAIDNFPEDFVRPVAAPAAEKRQAALLEQRAG
ncbi:MAG: NADH-ubiquinone oxidoreductase-F iron-sulfur binding region domain-containing protein [Geminicoccaceae bacterium]